MKKNIVRVNDMRMFKTTNEVLISNQPIVNQIGGLVLAGVDLNDLVLRIELKNAEIERTTQGITKNKHMARVAMQTKAQLIANRVMAWANSVEDNEHYATMSELIGGITVASDSICYTRCMNVANVAEGVLIELVNWKVVLADITDLKAKCAAFNALMITASVVEAEINTAIKVLDAMLKEGKKLMSQRIDKVVKSMKTDEFSFVAEYFAARRVQNLGHRYTQFKGVAVSGLTQDELRDVEIQFSNGTETFIAKTDENGKYVERLNPDVYDIVVSHPQYESFVIEGKRIEPGEIIVENFELKPKA